ncbi:MAG: hypothetical protein KA479_09355 [Saprospiraceae bacterium]|nr:hypothetical protein [Saprospiraceae bacterium]
MTALFSATTILILTFSLALDGCTTKTTGNSQSDVINSDTSLSTKQQPNKTNISVKQKDHLTKIYSQAIGDYIRLVKKEYNLTFDTLFFGKHVYGQPDDFPDIALPSAIENTKIKLISPEQGEKNQNERKSSFYINLIGWVNSYDADFIFVTFSNGFAHQFDCFITYKYDTNAKEFVMETTRFENYRYKKK